MKRAQNTASSFLPSTFTSKDAANSAINQSGTFFSSLSSSTTSSNSSSCLSSTTDHSVVSNEEQFSCLYLLASAAVSELERQRRVQTRGVQNFSLAVET